MTAETNKAVQALARKNNSHLMAGGENSPLGVRGSSSSLEAHLTYLLLEHGVEIYDPKEDITVAEHILANIEDVLEHFEDPLCQRIYRESIELVLAKKPVTAQHFIAQEDLELSGFAANLMHENAIEVDPHWEQRGFAPKGSSAAKPYLESIAKTIYRLKLKVVNQLCGQNLEQIRNVHPHDEQTMARLLSVQEKLNASRMELAGKIGLVR